MIKSVLLYNLADDLCIFCGKLWALSFCGIRIGLGYPHDAIAASNNLGPGPVVLSMNQFNSNIAFLPQSDKALLDGAGAFWWRKAPDSRINNENWPAIHLNWYAVIFNGFRAGSISGRAALTLAVAE